MLAALFVLLDSFSIGQIGRTYNPKNSGQTAKCWHRYTIPAVFFLKLSCSSFTIHLSYFIAQQQACIQIAATIYTQACPRTSLFCFLLYQLSLWWVKYRAQPEAINSWKHAGRNAPWQAETSWGEKVKPRKPAWNQAFLWLSICGCQVRNKNFCK